MTKEILKVQQQFFKAGTGDIGEENLGFAAGGPGAVAFGDVLPATAGGLHHLVVGAAAAVDEALTEEHGAIINERGHLKTTQLAVTARHPQAPPARPRI